MNYLSNIQELEKLDKDFKSFLAHCKETQEEYSKNELLFIWFAEYIIYIVTYDDSLSAELGEELYKVCKAIINKTEEEYLNDSVEKYKKYIVCLNIINNCDSEEVLDWGTSIRHPWFSYDSNKAILIENAVKYLDKELEDEE